MLPIPSASTIWACLALALGVLATIAWLTRTQWGAALTSAAFVPLSLLSLGYGIYFARETGWHGLMPIGSGDHPGTSLSGT
jgi:disulfide bond formation protein DsbB